MTCKDFVNTITRDRVKWLVNLITNEVVGSKPARIQEYKTELFKKNSIDALDV